MAPSALFSSYCSTTSSNSINFPLFSSKFSNLKPALATTTYIPLLKTTNNWASLSSDINTQIIKHLPKTAPLAVTEPMRRLVSAAPPSVASALCLAACELIGGEKSHAVSAACAVQLMHAAGRVHARPCHSGVDLMTADGLLSLGYEIVAASSSDGGGVDPETAVRVVLEIARAMGPQGGVVEGQLMEAEGGGESYRAWERKGGGMAACGAACGAIVGGGKEEEVERLRRFGMYVGIVTEMGSSDGHLASNCNYGEVVEMFKSLARLELQGFEEGRVDGVVGLFQLGRSMEGCNNNKDNGEIITSDRGFSLSSA